MEINNQAPLIAHKEIFIQASPEVVWGIHTDINAWSQWHSDISMSRLESPLAVGSLFHWKAGGLSLTSTIQEVEPNQRVSWIGKALGTRARHIWMFRPHQNGTLLTTEESLEGWLVSLSKVVMPAFLERSLATWLDNLKSKAESAHNRL